MAEEEEQGQSSSSSSSSSSFVYDVFLSFRGRDTRYGFTGNLYRALHDKGIRTFMDDQDLDRGDEITPALVKAIQSSRIAIVVLSENYASSSFCLDELSYIFDCIQLTVLPVFYDVDPSHVRHQLGSYGEALKKHEGRFKGNKDNMKRLENWKMSLKRVANLSGFHFNPSNEYEHKFIWSIVKLVSGKISRCPLHVADYLVGLESQVGRVNTLLEVGSNDGVLIVGIYGIGGIGKTTLARVVYNLIADQFEGICFLENVRENSSKYGLVHLQETLLHKTVGEKDIRLASVGEGISIMKQRFHQKKVLLILDDVDKGEQLQALVGGPGLFGDGSRVIITTRDKHMLACHGVERTHEADGLNEKDALELLSWKAFKNAKVDPSYNGILNRSVVYASGLPLALELIGSNLFGKSIEEWESALNEYKRVQPNEILKTLKVSYDALEENVKKVFLDIACFFKGYKLSEVEYMLCAHYGQDVKYHIRVLIDRSMMKTTWSNRVTLHDLLELMGKEIVRQEAPEDPGQRSRLWFHEDITQVLVQNEGTSKIQIIVLDFPKFEEEEEEEEVDWNGDAFKKMKNLKTLIIKKKVHISKGHKDRPVCFSSGPKHLPNSLRVLEWWGYPSQFLPSDFNTENLVIFKLSNSLLTLLGFPEMRKKFKNLRVLNFNGNECITHIPDISGSPKLEELSFVDCRNLITIDKSVGLLDKLKILDASGCINLGSFPPIKLISLQRLRFSRCWSLETFPEILDKMENIKQFSLEHTPIKEFPFSIQNLTQLERLHLDQCGRVQLPSSIVKLTKLWQVSIDGISAEVKENGTISDEFFPELLTCLANVRRLNLSNHDFRRFPESITKCHSLRELNLHCCHYLREIRCIPPKLETLSVESCTSLKVLDLTVPPASIHCLRKLTLDGCMNLQEIKGISPNIEDLSALRCESLTNSCRSMLLNQDLHEEAGNMSLSLPGNVVPEWFRHYSMRQSISFWFRYNFPIISLCLAIGQEDDTGIYFQSKLKINGKTVNVLQHKFEQKFFSKSPLWLEADHIFIFDLKRIKFKDITDEVHLQIGWNHAEVCFDTYNYNLEPIQLAIRTGFHVFTSKRRMADIRFTNPYERDYGRDSNSVASTKTSSTTNVKGLNSKPVSTDGSDLSKTNRKASVVSVPQILQSSKLKSFTMAVLKTATRNFRPDSLIGGEGGLGSVFKGWIHENSLAAAKPGTGGIAIAVKRLIQGGMQGLNLDGMQGHREWLAEVNFLGQFSHPHLVRLIGYCLEDEHCLLVYEFMSRGNLENHLFRRGSCSPLSWSLRLKVALDAAKGLAFLHSGENKVIYGGDFNASNILLDSSYNAKLSGFGLAKDGRPTGDKSYVTTRIMGNYGYAAPEYLATGHLTTESDVYSFGVVLLEMISGMRVVDKNRPYGQQNLVEWVKQLPLANKLKIFHLLDSQLEGQYSTDEVYRVLNLALQCLSTEIKDRPNMSEVVTILEQLQVKVSNVNGFNQDPNVNMSRSRRSIMSVISSFKF